MICLNPAGDLAWFDVGVKIMGTFKRWLFDTNINQKFRTLKIDKFGGQLDDFHESEPYDSQSQIQPNKMQVLNGKKMEPTLKQVYSR